MRTMIKVSLGICAYNEEKNIGRLLEAIRSQQLKRVEISEIIVIASGCTDRTEEIVRSFAAKDPRVRLITQGERRGKVSAVNLFLAEAREEILVSESADTLPGPETIENLVRPLSDPKVGITGAHPVPVNDPKTFMGFAAYLLWKLHHQVSLAHPKMGEMTAFRKIFEQIAPLSILDEANVEPLIRGQGYKAVYVPEAIVYNKGPETLGDFLIQRRRNYAGHLATKHEYGYQVSTLNGWRIFFLLLRNMEFSWRFLLWTPPVVFLEIFSRFLGFLDYKFRLRYHTIWEIAESTKSLE